MLVVTAHFLQASLPAIDNPYVFLAFFTERYTPYCCTYWYCRYLNFEGALYSTPTKSIFPTLILLCGSVSLNTYLFFTYLFIWLHWVLVVTCGIFWLWLVNCWLQHVGSSSLTRDQTWAPCFGSAEL